jgi:hypothetical protein
VSNFVTDLVRRGAGLPPPFSIRPAACPTEMPASPPASAENLASSQGITPSPAVAPSDRGRRLDISRPDSPVPTKAAPAPVGTSQVQGEHCSSARAANESGPLPPPSALTMGPAATSENLERHTPPLEEHNLPLIALPEPNPSPDAVLSPTPVHPLPRPEPSAIARVQPARAPSASGGREKTQDSRSIQVKIGKVEIRSDQPAAVVRRTRPSRTPGFDDMRLARTYLDRGTR